MENNKIDVWARGIAVIGILLSGLAIALPYIQAQSDAQEALSINITPENGNGIIRLSEDINQSRAIQIPYIVTLSNTGKVKLSIVSYTIRQLVKDQGVQMYGGLNGGLSSINHEPIQLPKNIDAGESITFRVHIGFLPTDRILNYLHKEYKLNGRLRVNKVFISLAKLGLTIYGGKANYKENENGMTIDIDALSNIVSPKYYIQFNSGRNNKFTAIASEYGFPGI